jgi:uncharacterized protein (TIGR02678 family)
MMTEQAMQDGYNSQPADTPEGQEEPTRQVENRLVRRPTPSADLTKAHLALMEKEMILPRQGDLFRLVQHYYHRLQSWHDQHTGWRIQRSSTVIRLVRSPGTITSGYLYERLKEPKDFACLVWTLWYAENRQLSGRSNDQQFLLSQLAEQIQEQSGQSAGDEHTLDFRRQADRYSIQRALQYLEDLGGLQLVDGQTRQWVEQTDNADALYEFTDVIRSLVVALNPQMVSHAATRLNDSAATLQPGLLPHMAGTPTLLRAWRALLLGPALFRFDDRSAFDELLAHAEAVASELLETFGWLLDIQRNYACIVRASGTSTGPVNALTPYGTSDQIAMLMCTAIRSQVEAGTWPPPDEYGCLSVMTEDMSDLFFSVRERYGENWGAEARNKSARTLLNDVYKKMRQVGLLRGPDEAGHVLILPTAARYAATYEKSGQETTPATHARTQKSSSKGTNGVVASKLPGIR